MKSTKNAHPSLVVSPRPSGQRSSLYHRDAGIMFTCLRSTEGGRRTSFFFFSPLDVTRPPPPPTPLDRSPLCFAGRRVPASTIQASDVSRGILCERGTTDCLIVRGCIFVRRYSTISPRSILKRSFCLARIGESY